MKGGQREGGVYGVESQKGQVMIKLFLGKVQGQPNLINTGLLRQNGCQQLLDSMGIRRGTLLLI